MTVDEARFDCSPKNDLIKHITVRFENLNQKIDFQYHCYGKSEKYRETRLLVAKYPSQWRQCVSRKLMCGKEGRARGVQTLHLAARMSLFISSSNTVREKLSSQSPYLS